MEVQRGEEGKLLPSPEFKKEEEEEESKKHWCLDDIEWAIAETHWMIMEFTASEAYQKNVSYEEQRANCYYNPLYHIGIIVGALCVLSGAYAHAPFGQGRAKVRPDESKVEHEARVQWILMTSGPFAVAAFFDLAYIVFVDPNPKVAVGLGVDLSFVLGNIMFLEAMRRRSKLLTRLAIVSNAVFAIGLVILLIGGLIYSVDSDQSSTYKIFDWIIRGITVILFLLATLIYSQLWHAYDDDDEEEEGVLFEDDELDSMSTSKPRAGFFAVYSNFIMAFLIAAAAVFIWFLFVFAVFLDGPKAIWAAVA